MTLIDACGIYIICTHPIFLLFLAVMLVVLFVNWLAFSLQTWVVLMVITLVFLLLALGCKWIIRRMDEDEKCGHHHRHVHD